MDTVASKWGVASLDTAEFSMYRFLLHSLFEVSVPKLLNFWTHLADKWKVLMKFSQAQIFELVNDSRILISFAEITLKC